MLLGYMPLWQELQTFDILGFQRVPSPTSCMTHVWDVCEIISFFIYIYNLHQFASIHYDLVWCWKLSSDLLMFVLCNAESPFQQEMRRECVPDYVAPSLGHVMGIDWDLPTFWIFRWLFEDHAPVGRRTNVIKIWSLRTTIENILSGGWSMLKIWNSGMEVGMNYWYDNLPEGFKFGFKVQICLFLFW